jgi:hypothetical protein
MTCPPRPSSPISFVVLGALLIAGVVPSRGQVAASETIARNEGHVVKAAVEMELIQRSSKGSSGHYASPRDVGILVEYMTTWGTMGRSVVEESVMEESVMEESAPDEPAPVEAASLEAEGESDGYRVRLAVPQDKSSYTFTATPVEYGKTGRVSIFLSEDGVVRGGDFGGREATHADAPLPGLKERIAAIDRREREEIGRSFAADRRAEESLRSSVKLGAVTFRLPRADAGSPYVPRVTLLIGVAVRTPGTYTFDVMYLGGPSSQGRTRAKVTRELAANTRVVEVDIDDEKFVWSTNPGTSEVEVSVSKAMTERQLYGRDGDRLIDWGVTHATLKIVGLAAFQKRYLR